ncbi:MAG: hypothetical protein BEN19_08940 [Epulopiscium sp. Nuni2H_MBin003]|nr:MAG: hypothetical protein BEN19_08940 [Epulopiscium sp. Nuni2H_MBin003]
MQKVSIGFRVKANEIYYCIVSNNTDDYTIKSISSLKVPILMDIPDKLAYIRNNIITIISQYNVCYAGIKLIEGYENLNHTHLFRFNLEGVLIELFSSTIINKYLLCTFNTISTILELTTYNCSDMMREVLDITDYKTDENQEVTLHYQEAILVALAVMVKEEVNDGIY